MADLLASGVMLNGENLQVLPLAMPSTLVTVSGVHSFISDKALKQGLRRFVLEWLVWAVKMTS